MSTKQDVSAMVAVVCLTFVCMAAVGAGLAAAVEVAGWFGLSARIAAGALGMLCGGLAIWAMAWESGRRFERSFGKCKCGPSTSSFAPTAATEDKGAGQTIEREIRGLGGRVAISAIAAVYKVETSKVLHLALERHVPLSVHGCLGPCVAEADVAGLTHALEGVLHA